MRSLADFDMNSTSKKHTKITSKLGLCALWLAATSATNGESIYFVFIFKKNKKFRPFFF